MSGFTLHAAQAVEGRFYSKKQDYDALRHEHRARVQVEVRAHGVAEHDEQALVAALKHAAQKCLEQFTRGNPIADVKLNMAEAALFWSQDMMDLALKGAGIPEPLLNRVILTIEQTFDPSRSHVVARLIGQEGWLHRERIEHFPSKDLVNSLLMLA